MGPPLYMLSVVDRNVVMRRIPVIGVSQSPAVALPPSQPTNKKAKDVGLRLNVSFSVQPFLRIESIARLWNGNRKTAVGVVLTL